MEVLLVRELTAGYTDGDQWSEEWDAVGRGLGSLAVGARLTFAQDVEGELLEHLPTGRGAIRLRFRGRGPGGLVGAAERIGTVPLPPYVEAARRRSGTGPVDEDRLRYQTVYARVPGAVAAPTAGLHFTEPLLAALRAAGHEISAVTLHVGPGTFRPVVADDPRQHHLDPEPYDVPAGTAAAVNRARAEGRPVVAVGTTVVRTLEAACVRGEVSAGTGWTNLYLLPGAPFEVVTDLITNFHLPRSTLLMLVAAFAGREAVLAAYDEAIRAGYRFYSYGDAMLIHSGELP